MAKQKSRKGKGSYVTYEKENRASKNRAKKLARHLKKHPNDAQAASAVGKDKRIRKKPMNRGNYPAAKPFVTEVTGQRVYVPEFGRKGA